MEFGMVNSGNVHSHFLVGGEYHGIELLSAKSDRRVRGYRQLGYHLDLGGWLQIELQLFETLKILKHSCRLTLADHIFEVLFSVGEDAFDWNPVDEEDVESPIWVP